MSKLLEALKQTEEFLELVDQHVANHIDCSELLQGASRATIVEICTLLKEQCVTGSNLFSSVPVSDSPDDNEAASQSREDGVELLLAVAITAKLILEEQTASSPDTLLEIATILHDTALLAAVEFPALQDEVCSLCCRWWQLDIAGKVQLMPQTVPYLVVDALQSGTATSIRRCYNMRKALELFDFEDPSIGDLKKLLLRAAFAPTFLRSADGRRFLSFLFTIQPAFIKELTAIMLNQIPSGRKSVLDAYAEILYRAWSTATGACLLEIQDGCIQGLMEAAILASTPALNAAIRKVLAGLHRQKHQPGVDKMLLDLYEPILFRRLGAANPHVRRNALQVFVDSFPLRDPEEANEVTDQRMKEHFQALSSLLRDDCPTVRTTAIQGVCQILNTYFEVIPGAVTAGYVKCIAGDLAFDSASPAVRVAAVEGIASLVDNTMAQPLLKIVLPSMQHLMFDSSVRVRIGMADLLLALRGMRLLPWHEVVDIKQLLDVVANDTPAVVDRIQRLLLPDYFPDLDSGPPLVAALLRIAPEAGQAFCNYLGSMPCGGGSNTRAAKTNQESSLPGGMAVADVLVALGSGLAAHLLQVQKSKGAGKKRRKAGNKQGEDEEAAEVSHVVETEDSWEAILGGLRALCTGIATSIANNTCDTTIWNEIFEAGDEVSGIYTRCIRPAAYSDVAQIVASVGKHDAVTQVRNAIVEQLLDGSIVDSQELKAALSCTAATPESWNALLVSIALALGLPGDECNSILVQHQQSAGAVGGSKAGKNKRSVVVVVQTTDMTMLDAVRYLSCWMELDVSREMLVSSGVLAKLLPKMQQALEAEVCRLESITADGEEDGDGNGSVVPPHQLLQLYMRSTLHLLLSLKNKDITTINDNNNNTDAPPPAAADDDDASGSNKEVSDVETYTHHMTEAFVLTTRVLQVLQQEDGEELLQAIAGNAVVKPSKRAKATKNAPAVKSSSRGLDALQTACVCVALTADALRIHALDSMHDKSEQAIETATNLLTVVNKLAGPLSNTASFLTIEVFAAAAHCTRVARCLLLVEGGTDNEATVQCPLEACLSQLMQLVVTACGTSIKPHLSGLLGALAAKNNQNSSWIAPVVALLGQGIDVEQALLSLKDNAENTDNAPAPDDATTAAVAMATAKEIFSEAADQAEIKQLIAACKVADVNEWMAETASDWAVASYDASQDVEQVVGAIELVQLLGFKGVTSRNKSKAGSGTFKQTIIKLRVLQEKVAAAAAAEGDNQQQQQGGSALLNKKLAELFPVQQHVTFTC